MKANGSILHDLGQKGLKRFGYQLQMLETARPKSIFKWTNR